MYANDDMNSMVVGITKLSRDSENSSEESVKIWEGEACKLHQPLVRYICYCDLFIKFQ